MSEVQQGKWSVVTSYWRVRIWRPIYYLRSFPRQVRIMAKDQSQRQYWSETLGKGIRCIGNNLLAAVWRKWTAIVANWLYHGRFQTLRKVIADMKLWKLIRTAQENEIPHCTTQSDFVAIRDFIITEMVLRQSQAFVNSVCQYLQPRTTWVSSFLTPLQHNVGYIVPYR